MPSKNSTLIVPPGAMPPDGKLTMLQLEFNPPPKAPAGTGAAPPPAKAVVGEEGAYKANPSAAVNRLFCASR